MQVVIDISEEEYNLIKMKSESNIGGVSSEAEQVIAKGILLPKGHGRLVDADAILEDPFGNTYKDIDIAETIIEADTERIV